MSQLKHREKSRDISAIGRILYFIDFYICENFRIFLKKHDGSVQIMFLAIYTFLQGMLIVTINVFDEKVNLIISVFTLTLLFFVACS